MPDKTPTTTILISPAGAGKTARLVELLVGDDQAIRPRWAVLPDRVQVSSFRRQIAQSGGALGVSVGTFGDLFQEILARAGRSIAVTPEPARQRVLRLALRQLEAHEQLPYYQSIFRTPGFLTAVGEAIGELKRGRVAPEQVRRLKRPAMQEIGSIFNEYESRLKAVPWTDREGLNNLAIHALNEYPGLLTDMPLIAIDGFDNFDAAQLEALSALAGQVERLIVTLPGSGQFTRTAHRRFARPFDRLREALPEAAIEEPDRRVDLSEPLRQLEAGLFEQDAAEFEAQGAIEMIEARSPADESREAIRWIKAHLVRGGTALEDCAVVAPDPTLYDPPLRRAAAEFGVRLRFTHGFPLIQAPSISTLMDLLELSRSNWPRRLTLQTIRSPYLDLTEWGLGSEDAIALDAASHAGQVIEGLDQWEQALAQLAQAEAEPESDEGAPIFAAPRGERAALLNESLHLLARRLTPAAKRSTSGWVEWIENLLDDLDFAELSNDERDHPAFVRLRETLRALVLGEIVAGEMDVSIDEFLDELRTAVETATFREGGPLYEPAVNVLRPLEARGGRYEALVVMGLSEGLLPEIEREDPFLDEETRRELGLESRLGLEQGGLFYQAVTRAHAHLLMTRPYLADDGEAWEPSPFWRGVERLLADGLRRVRPEAPRALQEAGSPEELIFWGVRRGGMPASLLDAHTDRWNQLRHAQRVLFARGEPEAAGPFEGDLSAQGKSLRARFGPDHTWSPSRLEKYGTCPHMFYSAQLLHLELREPPVAGLDPAQVGSMLHEILEEVYPAAEDPANVESVLDELERVAEPIMEQAPAKRGFRPTPLWEIEREQYAEALRETVRELAEEGTGWTPDEFELRFGIGENAPLELDTGSSIVKVRGIVDRLDRREDGGLRVIDYKTYGGQLNAGELDEGRRIQLPLYALAAQDALKLGEVVEGFYWKILAAKRGPLRLSNYRAQNEEGAAGPEVAYATVRKHVGRIVEGVASGHFEPEPPPGGCPSYCPAATYCWRYQPRAGGR